LSYDSFYFIGIERLYDKNDVDWLYHLRLKRWFKNKIEKDFLEMFYMITMLKHGKESMEYVS